MLFAVGNWVKLGYECSREDREGKILQHSGDSQQQRFVEFILTIFQGKIWNF